MAKRGDPVRVFIDDHPFEGAIVLASENMRSIAVELHGFPLAADMALLADDVDAGLYRDVMTGCRCRLEFLRTIQ